MPATSNQPESPKVKESLHKRCEDGLFRSSCIRVNAGLRDGSSGLKTEAVLVMVEMLGDLSEHAALSQAASHPRWPEATRSEYNSLKADGTFPHVKNIDRKSIWCKWVFKSKSNPDGTTC